MRFTIPATIHCSTPGCASATNAEMTLTSNPGSWPRPLSIAAMGRLPEGWVYCDKIFDNHVTCPKCAALRATTEQPPRDP